MEKFIKFGLVGILNTIITIIVFNIFNFIGINYIIANSIGYCAGMINSYVWNNRWVFKANSKEVSTIGKFIIVNIIVLLINNGILILLVNKIGLSTIIAQVVALVITTILNFIGNKLWTFN